MTDPATDPATSSTSGPALEAVGLRVGHGRGRDVITGLDLAIGAGEITALVGPNGSGKSTLLHALARVIAPREGEVRLHGRPLSGYGTRAIARRLALLPQDATIPAGATVAELVAQGRHPRAGLLGMLRARDDAAVAAALEVTGMTPWAHARADRLSGGQRQRAWIAVALAQETELLLLDEPTTFLDVGHQATLMRLVERLREQEGKTVVMVLHDLNQAARHADRLVVLAQGAIVADGTPQDVLTAALLAEVFDLDAVVLPDPVSGRPMFVPR